ncbi:response regulator [Verrucomicrobiota bacterium]
MPAQSKGKILIIDDDKTLLGSLKRLLIVSDYEVSTMDDAKKALDLLGKIRPDLIILDMAMPGMSGLSFLKEISDSNGKPEYPILVLTARANMEDFFSNINVDGFLEKPCTTKMLETEIEKILSIRGRNRPKIPETVEEEPQIISTGIPKVLLTEDDKRTDIQT